MRIGIFGGSFDPVHKGHETLVHHLKEALSLDKVLVIPTATSPFKQNAPPRVSAEDRLALVKLAFQDDPSIEVLSLEIDRGGVSYTIDTVREIKKKYPSDELFLLVSEENKEKFGLWKEAEELQKNVTVVFAGIKKSSCQYGEIIPIPRIDISSTKIRKEGPYASRDYLSPKVLDYIEKHHLYY